MNSPILVLQRWQIYQKGRSSKYKHCCRPYYSRLIVVEYWQWIFHFHVTGQHITHQHFFSTLCELNIICLFDTEMFESCPKISERIEYSHHINCYSLKNNDELQMKIFNQLLTVLLHYSEKNFEYLLFIALIEKKFWNRWLLFRFSEEIPAHILQSTYSQGNDNLFFQRKNIPANVITALADNYAIFSPSPQVNRISSLHSWSWSIISLLLL